MTWAQRLAALPLGTRVVVRYVVESGSATDALGDLVACDTESCIVRTRRGDVEIAAAAIVAAKPVPPPPVRRTRTAPSD